MHKLDVDLIERLIKDTNIDKNGNTPLHIAIQHRLIYIVGLLRSQGAITHHDRVKNKDGKTPLDVAQSYLDTTDNPLTRDKYKQIYHAIK